MKITVGADPEVFVTERGGRLVPAVGMVPGTKEIPHKVQDGMVQVDGLALEYGVDPASSLEEFQSRIEQVRNTMQAMIPDEYVLSQRSVAHFTRKQLMGVPKENLELGCEPDWNAYTEDQNPRPVPPKDMRTAGGHVHIGWTEAADPHSFAHFKSCARLCKELDYRLGLPSLFLDRNDERRKLYGQAGAFRPKPYGMEYRVLSNFWIFNPLLVEWVYETVQLSVKQLVEKKDCSFRYEKRAQLAINRSNRDKASRYILDLALIDEKFAWFFPHDTFKGYAQ